MVHRFDLCRCAHSNNEWKRETSNDSTLAERIQFIQWQTEAGSTDVLSETFHRRNVSFSEVNWLIWTKMHTNCIYNPFKLDSKFFFFLQLYSSSVTLPCFCCKICTDEFFCCKFASFKLKCNNSLTSKEVIISVHQKNDHKCI